MNRRKALLLVIAVLLSLMVAIPSAQAEESSVASPASEARGGILLVGKVGEVEERQLQVQTPDGTWTVLLGEDTVIRLPGVPEATWQDVQVGTAIMVRGRVTGVDTMEGAVVSAPRGMTNLLGQLVSSLKRARRLQGALKGEVVGVGEDQVTLQAGDREVAISVDDETVYRVPGVEDPGLSDIEPGQFVLVRVPQGEDEAARLLAVVMRAQMKKLAAEGRLLRTIRSAVGATGVRGEVIAVNADGLIVSTAHGEVSVKATESTRFWVRGQEEATLADISVGDVVLVMGRPDLSCPIDAIGVRVIPEQPQPED